jgi:hypothetical protein
MSAPAARIRRTMGWLLADPAVVPLLAAIYVGVGAIFVFTDYTLNDEGLLTYYWANWARHAFVPVFFFQRVRPILCALYLPVSAAGVHWTLVAHVLVASLALPMLAAVARALGYRLPNLPAFALALSPLFFYGGPAGFSNADGAVGICLALYLLCARRWPLAAGLVIGLLPWVRSELAIFAAVAALHGLLVRRDRALLAGIAVFPLLYLAAGALYHRDPIWMLHFFPKSPSDPSDPMWKGQLIGVQYFLEPLLAVTPIAALAIAVRPSRLQPIEWTLLFYLLAAALVINVLPVFEIGNFGTSPRFSMALLPPLALLVGRAFDPWWGGDRPALPILGAMLVLAIWLATRQQNGTAAALLLVGNGLLIGSISLRLWTTAAGLALVLMAVGPILPVHRDVGRSVTAPYLDPLLDWLRAHPEQISGPVLTNSQLLSAFLESRLPDVDVRFIVPPEMSRDLVMLSNPANGQQDWIRRVSENDFYGRTLFAPFAPDEIPPNALFALRVDPRLSILLPETVWGTRLDVLEDTPQIRIARLRSSSGGRR